MLARCRFGWDADAIAAAAGLSVLAPYGFGSSGSAYMLDDGRVLKLTTSRGEAALAAFLASGEAAGLPLPRVDAVLLFEADGLACGDCWVIVREDVQDLWPDPDSPARAKAAAWDDVYRRWNASWDAGLSAAILASWDHHGPELRELTAGLDRLRSTFGIDLGDWWAENVGRAEDGRVMMRDLSHVQLPAAMHRLADAEVLETIRLQPWAGLGR